MTNSDKPCNDYVVGMWVSALPGLLNWLGTAYRREDGSYFIETRLRLETDNKIWDSNDPKYWQNFTIPADDPRGEDDVIEMMSKLRQHMMDRLGIFHHLMFREDLASRTQSYDIIIQSADGDVILEKLKPYPFMNITKFPVPPEDPSVN